MSRMAARGWSVRPGIIKALEDQCIDGLPGAPKQLAEEGLSRGGVEGRKANARRRRLRGFFDGEKEAKLIGLGLVPNRPKGRGARDLALVGRNQKSWNSTSSIRASDRHDRPGSKKNILKPHRPAAMGHPARRPTAAFVAAMGKTCCPSTRGHMILIARWFAVDESSKQLLAETPRCRIPDEAGASGPFRLRVTSAMAPATSS